MTKRTERAGRADAEKSGDETAAWAADLAAGEARQQIIPSQGMAF